jgi:hypothetical protein
MTIQRDYMTLHMQQTVTFNGYIHHRQYLTDNAGFIDNKREIFMYNETREILFKVDYWR